MNTPSRPAIRKTSRLSGAALLAVAQAVLLALGYITHIVIGKLGGPSLYGVYGLMISLMTILNMFLTLGIPTAVSKEVAEDEQNSGAILSSAMKGQISFSILMSIGTLILARPIALLFGDATLTPIIMFTAIIYPLTGVYAIFSNYFNGLHAFGIQALLITLYAIAKLGGSIILLFPFRVPGALAGFAVGGVIAGIIGFALALPTLRGRSVRPVPIKRLTTFAGAFVGTSIALQILMSTDLFLVKRILHDDALTGYYNAAVTLARIPYFILQALGFVFLPSVARLMHENVDAARAFIRDIFRYLFLLLLPVTAVSAVTSKGLVYLFFSRAYERAAHPLTFLMVALGLLSAFYLLSTIAAGAGKPRVPFLISSALVPLSVIFGYLFIPRFGLEGAALETICASAIGAVGIGAYMYTRFRLTFPLRTLVAGVVATIVMIIPTYFVKPPTIFLPLEYLILFGIYLFTLIAFGEIRADDVSHLKRLMPKSKASAPSSIEEPIIEE